MDKYIPPFDITEDMLDLVAEIMETLGQLGNVNKLERLPRLRKVNRIKSIHSSLAIENNTLSIEQVTDIIDGKRVVGPQEDIIAVKNANAAYKMLEDIDPYDIGHLLKAHGIMMSGLVSEAGTLCTGQVGVYSGDGEVIHIAPSSDMVPSLMYQLFEWLRNAKINMLIKSCIFHYEFEFIHPFRDGNGRMGRLWQTALLASWKQVFAWVPIESIIKNCQEDYYNAISLSTSQGKSNIFIAFMLDVLNKSIKEMLRDTQNHSNHLSCYINALMQVVETYPQSAIELMNKLGLKSKDSFRQNYLVPAIKAGLISMTLPDKPTSKNQRYFKI